MIKKILKIVFVLLLIPAIYFGKIFYKQYQDHFERKAYRESLVDTSTPTVSVLRDTVLIDYQNDKRTLHVYVPPDYGSDTSKHYPVIYLMDGESAFNDLEFMGPEWQVDEMINEAHAEGRSTAIVIGVNQADDRDPEYLPYAIKECPHAHGDKFAEWMASDLKTWVDENYRTLPDPESTTIGGISLSGMMAYYMVMKFPDVYGNALIQSPSMWTSYRELFSLELTQKQLEFKKIFVSVGEEEGGNMVPHAKDVYRKFKKQGLDEDQLRIEIIEDEGHYHTTWRKSFALAYPWLMD